MENRGLQISRKKTAYMVSNGKDVGEDVQLLGKKTKGVNTFKCLSSHMLSEGTGPRYKSQYTTRLEELDECGKSLVR